LETNFDGFVKSLKNAILSLPAERGNLRTARIAKRLPRRSAPRTDVLGLFTRPSILMRLQYNVTARGVPQASNSRRDFDRSQRPAL